MGSATPVSGTSGALPFAPTQRSVDSDSVLAATAKRYGLQFASTATKNTYVDAVKITNTAKYAAELDENADETPAT